MFRINEHILSFVYNNMQHSRDMKYRIISAGRTPITIWDDRRHFES